MTFKKILRIYLLKVDKPVFVGITLHITHMGLNMIKKYLHLYLLKFSKKLKRKWVIDSLPSY